MWGGGGRWVVRMQGEELGWLGLAGWRWMCGGEVARWDVDGWRCAPGAVEGVAEWLRDGWDEVGGGEAIKETGKGSVW